MEVDWFALRQDNEEASACAPSWPSAPTACLRAEPKSALPAAGVALVPFVGRMGGSGEYPPMLTGMMVYL